MKRATLSFCCFLLLSVTASAQTSETVKRSVQHPDREAQAAKADVYTHRNEELKTITNNRKIKAKAIAQKRKRTCGTPTSKKD